MSELVTSGSWIVKPGDEEAFIEAWTAFVEWAATQPGAQRFRLTRDTEIPEKFVSYAAWADEASVRAWKSTPEFQERISRPKSHTTAFKPHELEVVATVAATVGSER